MHVYVYIDTYVHMCVYRYMCIYIYIHRERERGERERERQRELLDTKALKYPRSKHLETKHGGVARLVILLIVSVAGFAQATAIMSRVRSPERGSY